MRFRLYPTPAQEDCLRGHCAQARFVWNLALEQANWYRPEWGPTPGYVAQSAQLTEPRAASGWLAAGSFTVQQQALRDFAQAMKNWWAGTHGRPTWRQKGRHACGHVAAENRKSQAVFGCVACGHVAHADVNAALNILAAGRAVTAHGEAVVVASMNCEPQHAPPTAA